MEEVLGRPSYMKKKVRSESGLVLRYDFPVCLQPQQIDAALYIIYFIFDKQRTDYLERCRGRLEFGEIGDMRRLIVNTPPKNKGLDGHPWIEATVNEKAHTLQI